MRRHWILIVGLILVGGGLVQTGMIESTWPPRFGTPAAPPAEASEVLLISSEELKRRLDLGAEILVLDVRRKTAYEQLHLPGAISLPMNDHASWGPKLSKDVSVVLYCACEGDETSLLAARKIQQQYGHPQVFVLKGGLGDWVDAGYPVVERSLPPSLRKVKAP